VELEVWVGDVGFEVVVGVFIDGGEDVLYEFCLVLLGDLWLEVVGCYVV